MPWRIDLSSKPSGMRAAIQPVFKSFLPASNSPLS